MGIKAIIEKLRAKKAEEKEYEANLLMQKKVAARMLNSNERELLRFKEEERQRAIKLELEAYRKEMNHDTWSGKTMNPVYAKNVIRGGKELYRNGKNIFAGAQSVFNQDDLFFGK